MDNIFDVLYNNVTSNQAPGLNAYEKSVFLTKGQNEILKNYFNPKSKGNITQDGFDGSAKRQVDFSTLIHTWSKESDFDVSHFDPRDNTQSILLPEGMFLGTFFCIFLQMSIVFPMRKIIHLGVVITHCKVSAESIC